MGSGRGRAGWEVRGLSRLERSLTLCRPPVSHGHSACVKCPRLALRRAYVCEVCARLLCIVYILYNGKRFRATCEQQAHPRTLYVPPAPRVHDNHLGLSRRAPHVMPLRVRFGADGEASYVRSWSGSPRHALRLCVSLALCRGGLGTATGRRSRRPHSSAGASATVTGGGGPVRDMGRYGEIWGDMATVTGGGGPVRGGRATCRHTPARCSRGAAEV